MFPVQRRQSARKIAKAQDRCLAHEPTNPRSPFGLVPSWRARTRHAWLPTDRGPQVVDGRASTRRDGTGQCARKRLPFAGAEGLFQPGRRCPRIAASCSRSSSPHPPGHPRPAGRRLHRLRDVRLCRRSGRQHARPGLHRGAARRAGAPARPRPAVLRPIRALPLGRAARQFRHQLPPGPAGRQPDRRAAAGDAGARRHRARSWRFVDRRADRGLYRHPPQLVAVARCSWWSA